MCFFSREGAEKAISTLFEKLYLCEKKIKLDWAKAQLQEQKAYRKKGVQPGKVKGGGQGDGEIEESKDGHGK